ncbi:MAG: hypothetical protein WC340_05855 [Kiritimatiellia bacterium]
MNAPASDSEVQCEPPGGASRTSPPAVTARGYSAAQAGGNAPVGLGYARHRLTMMCDDVGGRLKTRAIENRRPASSPLS